MGALDRSNCPLCGDAIRRRGDPRPLGPQAPSYACRSCGAAVTDAHLAAPETAPEERNTRRLAVREMEVLSSFAAGKTTKGTARVLGISPRTVEAYSASLGRKLGARNRIHAVAIAIRTGLLRTAPLSSPPRHEPDASVARSAKRLGGIAGRPDGATHSFIGNDDLGHLANRLGIENDRARRDVLLRLMVEEEDRLGFGLEQLGLAEARLAAGHKRIAMQRAVVARLGESGHDTRLANDVLATLVKAQALFEDYRQKIVRQLDASPV